MYSLQDRAEDYGFSTAQDYVDAMVEDPDYYGANKFVYTGETFNFNGNSYYLWENTNSETTIIMYMLTDTIDYNDLYSNSMEADVDNEYCPYVALLSDDMGLYRENDGNDWLIKVERIQSRTARYLYFDDFVNGDDILTLEDRALEYNDGEYSSLEDFMDTFEQLKDVYEEYKKYRS